MQGATVLPGRSGAPTVTLQLTHVAAAPPQLVLHGRVGAASDQSRIEGEVPTMHATSGASDAPSRSEISRDSTPSGRRLCIVRW